MSMNPSNSDQAISADTPAGKAEPDEELLLGYLADLDTRKTELYLSRGRVHRDASLEAVTEGWLASFAGLPESVGSEAAYDRFDAYDAELRLRGVEPPYEQARGIFDRLVAATDRAKAEMRKDAARYRAADEALGSEIAAYAAQRERTGRTPN